MRCLFDPIFLQITFFSAVFYVFFHSLSRFGKLGVARSSVFESLRFSSSPNTLMMNSFLCAQSVGRSLLSLFLREIFFSEVRFLPTSLPIYISLFFRQLLAFLAGTCLPSSRKLLEACCVVLCGYMVF